MIHELREYEIAKAQCSEYLTLLKEVGIPIRGDHFGRLVGAWLIKDADPARFIHIWEYATYDDRTEKRAALAEIDAWRNIFLPKASALVSSQRVGLLTPVDSKNFSGCLAMPLFLHQVQCRLGKTAPYVSKLAAHSQYDSFAIWRMEIPDPNSVMVLSNSANLDKTGPVTDLSEEIIPSQSEFFRNVQTNELTSVALRSKED